MKKQGATLEFAAERTAELISAFGKAMKNNPSASIRKLGSTIVKMPCSRFWVSEERACAVIYNLRRGLPLPPTMVPAKQRMFTEIHRRVEALHASQPDAPVNWLVAQVLYTKAPEFYMDPTSAVSTYYRHYRNRHADKKRQ